MAKVPARVLDRIREQPQSFPLPLEPMHGWRSSPDEGDHTHCECCAATIYRGDPVVGCYLKYVSVVFCEECVADNTELFREWLASRPGSS
ncbi:MAG: hypothetical protein K8T89_19025 [Planctomycetes bacterium]|nr:hypothetical protein [Planctomycetota bacterium]